MLLGFKRRFEEKILSGVKRHTIRGKRKVRPRVGETCHCYVDPRQKSMRLLGRWECARVQDITLYVDLRASYGVAVFIDGIGLDASEKDSLAVADGFESFSRMAEFWEGRLPFRGDVIHWKFSTEGRAAA